MLSFGQDSGEMFTSTPVDLREKLRINARNREQRKRGKSNIRPDKPVRQPRRYQVIKGKGISLRKTMSQLSLTSLKRLESYNRKIACWNCKRTGHRRINCRLPPKIFCSYCQKEDIRTKDCRCRERLPGDVEKFRQLMHEPLEALRLIQVGTGYGLRVDVKILDRRFTAIVDTGASTLLVGETVQDLCAIFEINAVTDDSATVILANNQVTEVSGILKFEMTVGIKTRVVEALIVPGLKDDILIGFTTLMAFGFEFTFGGQTVDNNSPITEAFPEPYCIEEAR